MNDMIWFNVPQAFYHLMKYGKVYTLRDHVKTEGVHPLRSSLALDPDVGKVYVSYITFIRRKEELQNYFKNSGFTSIDAWVKAAKGAPFLHEVSIIKKEPAKEREVIFA